MEIELRRIAIWADYIWCDVAEVEEYMNLGWSDDYAIVAIPAILTDEELDYLVTNKYNSLVKGANNAK